MSDDLSPITLDRLFRSTKPVQVGTRTLMVRALSSYELRSRYDDAMLASLAARREMKDPASRRYQLAIATVLEAADDDALRSLLVLATRNKAELDAAVEIQPEFAAIPDGASEDETRDALEARQASIDKTAGLRETYVQNKADNRQTEVADWDRAKLEAAYVRAATAITVDNVFGEAYNLAGLLYGVRNPDGTPYFDSLEDVRAVHDSVRTRLTVEMRSVNDLNPLDSSGPSSTATPPAPGDLPAGG